MFTIGLLEDEEFIFANWEILAEDSTIPCKVKWFDSGSKLLKQIKHIDVLIMDRDLEGFDVISSGFINTVRDKFSGPILLASVSTPSKSERDLFDKVLYNKRPISIKELFEFYQQSSRT